MLDFFGITIKLLDLAAFCWFLTVWTVYSYIVDFSDCNRQTLVNVMHKYRLRWIKSCIKREDRLVDIRIVANLVQTSTFLASTSILIIGGLGAMLGYGEKAIAMLSHMPFAIETSLHMWVIKTLLLLVIFIHSFFKLTWVIRQFNFSTVLIVAAPRYIKGESDLKNTKESARYVIRISTIISNAGRHFNMGLRSYYFGLVALSWYISPVLFIILSVLVILVLYRREFVSRTLDLLK